VAGLSVPVDAIHYSSTVPITKNHGKRPNDAADGILRQPRFGGIRHADLGTFATRAALMRFRTGMEFRT
jgi:hypothetical protein